MGPLLKILIYFYLCTGVQGIHWIPWLDCHFTDELVSSNSEGRIDIQPVFKKAMLQFGKNGDAPVNPEVITFLITGSRLDLRKHLEGVEVEQLECMLHRYSTEGIHVRWPVQGAQGYNRWYTATLKHSKGLFTITGFLRQPSDQPAPGQQDYRSWPAIADREILTTTVAMVIKSQTPSVKAGLNSQQKLHCHFDVDHRGPHISVEWHQQRRGERTKLFSHTSRTGQTEGAGVAVKALKRGDASYTLPFTKMSSEGTYICSVSVIPLFTSVDINLQIEEPPQVSINVDTVLTLQDGSEQKVVCEADSYYPLDVEIVWYEQDPSASSGQVSPQPKVLESVLLSSHKQKRDSTYTVSAFFYLQASFKDSGKRFACSVSHQSLRMPIRKTFKLIIKEPGSWMFTLLGFVLVCILVNLAVMWYKLHLGRRSGRREYEKKPY